MFFAVVFSMYLLHISDLSMFINPFFQVITLPRTNIGDCYYLCKLNCYNLTVFELGACHGHCYLWHEGQMGRTASDIATALRTFLEEVDRRGTVDQIVL